VNQLKSIPISANHANAEANPKDTESRSQAHNMPRQYSLEDAPPQYGMDESRLAHSSPDVAALSVMEQANFE
jgi:hypothetical protein